MDHAAELRESRIGARLARRQPIEKGPQTFLDDGKSDHTSCVGILAKFGPLVGFGLKPMPTHDVLARYGVWCSSKIISVKTVLSSYIIGTKHKGMLQNAYNMENYSSSLFSVSDVCPSLNPTLWIK